MSIFCFVFKDNLVITPCLKNIKKSLIILIIINEPYENIVLVLITSLIITLILLHNAINTGVH